MPQPIKLTYAEVVEAGRKAYLEGRLSAQGPTPACAYRDNSGRPCVIGAAIPDEEAAHLQPGSVTRLCLTGQFTVAPREIKRLQRLQSTHDDWACGVKRAEARLRKLLNIEEAA